MTDLQKEVERLKAEHSKMREALQHIVDPTQHHECCMEAWKKDNLDNHLVEIALNALRHTPKEPPSAPKENVWNLAADHVESSELLIDIEAVMKCKTRKEYGQLLLREMAKELREMGKKS